MSVSRIVTICVPPTRGASLDSFQRVGQAVSSHTSRRFENPQTTFDRGELTHGSRSLPRGTTSEPEGWHQSSGTALALLRVCLRCSRSETRLVSKDATGLCKVSVMISVTLHCRGHQASRQACRAVATLQEKHLHVAMTGRNQSRKGRISILLDKSTNRTVGYLLTGWFPFRSAAVGSGRAPGDKKSTSKQAEHLGEEARGGRYSARVRGEHFSRCVCSPPRVRSSFHTFSTREP